MPHAPLEAYLAVSAVIFAIGTVGVLTRRSPLAMLMSVEVMWNAANLAFITFARHWGGMEGHVFAFLAITIAAAEVGIGLAIIVLVFRHREAADADDVYLLRG